MIGRSTSSHPSADHLSADGPDVRMAGNDQPSASAEGRPTGGSRSHRGRVPGRVCGRVCSVGAVLAVLAAAVAGCGSSATPTSSSSVTSTGSSSLAAASSASSTSSARSSSASSEISSSVSYPAGKEQICQARDQLRTSITALTDQGLLAAGTTAIKASVDQVQTDFDAVKTAAKQDYHAQVTDMQDALQQLQTAVGNLGNGDAAANLLAVGKAVTATAAAAEDLFTQLKTACGS